MIGVVTLVIGLILGYMGQRSRFCTISGIRDFYLVRDTYRLKGLIGIIIGGVIGFSIFNLLGGDFPGFPLLSDGINIEPPSLIPLMIFGAFGMAFFSTMAEGCPFRQHVMFGEGRMSGILYIAGLVIGIIFFDIVIIPYLQLLTIVG
ncbi:MAG: YeeE/YedE thiosulfate transporter family protein [Chloroflexota bacterium]